MLGNISPRGFSHGVAHDLVLFYYLTVVTVLHFFACLIKKTATNFDFKIPYRNARDRQILSKLILPQLSISVAKMLKVLSFTPI